MNCPNILSNSIQEYLKCAMNICFVNILQSFIFMKFLFHRESLIWCVRSRFVYLFAPTLQDALFLGQLSVFSILISFSVSGE